MKITLTFAVAILMANFAFAMERGQSAVDRRIATLIKEKNYEDAWFLHTRYCDKIPSARKIIKKILNQALDAGNWRLAKEILDAKLFVKRSFFAPGRYHRYEYFEYNRYWKDCAQRLADAKNQDLEKLFPFNSAVAFEKRPFPEECEFTWNYIQYGRGYLTPY